MEFLFELLFDCIIEPIIECGVEVLTGNERTRHWHKGVKIALAVVTLLVFVAVIGAIIIFGIMLLIEGTTIPGIVLLVIAITFIILSVLKIRKEYRKRRT